MVEHFRGFFVYGDLVRAFLGQKPCWTGPVQALFLCRRQLLSIQRISVTNVRWNAKVSHQMATKSFSAHLEGSNV